MKSNGGAMPGRRGGAEPDPDGASPVRPAGCWWPRPRSAIRRGSRLLTLDMGGTSADVGIILDGQQRHTTEYEIEWGVPAAIPLIDIKSIGAGGGSIAWIDAGGFLRVGPESARAVPGPACYGLGGTRPTVTDANLLLGRLDPDYFLGGPIRLIKPRQNTGRGARTARPSRPVATAQAVIDIANEGMVDTIRVRSIERGVDPREFALVAFGGAGPLHAADIAATLGMQTCLCRLSRSRLGLRDAPRRTAGPPGLEQALPLRCGRRRGGRRPFRRHGQRYSRSARRRGVHRRAGGRSLAQHALLGAELRAGRTAPAGPVLRSCSGRRSTRSTASTRRCTATPSRAR